jgi:threo-3-hydroxy-L-aspartate ammonia-lyase
MIAALDGLDPREVWGRVSPGLVPSRLSRLPALDGPCGGARVTVATETSQLTGSFKYRAALSVALHTDAPRLLTASSGNFGAALAAAAARSGKGCTVVMPDRSAEVKIAAVRSHGAHVDLIDTTRTSREARVAELAKADPEARVVSPFDDPYVICGNGTLGAEILERLEPPGPELIVAPVGGGGLSSGLVVATRLLRPDCAVVGAEPALANDAARSLRAGTLIVNDTEPDTVCDGARTRSLGKRNFAILREGLSAIVEVSEDDVAHAMQLLASLAGIRAEPTGALGLAAILTEPERFRGHEVVCVVSGGNVDSGVYARMTSGVR